MQEFARSFNNADVLFITDIYAASEDPIEGVTAEALTAAIKRFGHKDVNYIGPLDNAAAESFHSTIKVEYVHRRRFATRTEARLKIATWITDFYNTRRRHSAAGGLPPVEPEPRHRRYHGLKRIFADHVHAAALLVVLVQVLGRCACGCNDSLGRRCDSHARQLA